MNICSYSGVAVVIVAILAIVRQSRAVEVFFRRGFSVYNDWHLVSVVDVKLAEWVLGAGQHPQLSF